MASGVRAASRGATRLKTLRFRPTSSRTASRKRSVLAQVARVVEQANLRRARSSGAGSGILQTPELARNAAGELVAASRVAGEPGHPPAAPQEEQAAVQAHPPGAGDEEMPLQIRSFHAEVFVFTCFGAPGMNEACWVSEIPGPHSSATATPRAASRSTTFCHRIGVEMLQAVHSRSSAGSVSNAWSMGETRGQNGALQASPPRNDAEALGRRSKIDGVVIGHVDIEKNGLEGALPSGDLEKRFQIGHAPREDRGGVVVDVRPGDPGVRGIAQQAHDLGFAHADHDGHAEKPGGQAALTNARARSTMASPSPKRTAPVTARAA